MALAQAARLIAVEPDNSLWSDMAASVRLGLAGSLLALGHSEEAANEASAGCAAAAALRARDGNVARWRTLQTTCLEIRSRLALADGAATQALTLANEALKAAQAERSGDKIMDRYRIAEAYRLLGDVQQKAGNRQGALAAWSTGAGQLPGGVAERPWEMNERAELLRRLGRPAEAAPLDSKLASIGYRSVT